MMSNGNSYNGTAKTIGIGTYDASQLVSSLDDLYTTNQWTAINSDLYNRMKSDYGSEFAEETIGVLNEKEIMELFEKIISRTSSQESSINRIIQWTVRERHFSEGFLMKMYSEKRIDKSDILSRHRADIRSGQYAELAVLLELNN